MWMGNILSNFIPHTLIVFEDKDPPWFHTKTKSLLHEKIKTYKVKTSAKTLGISIKLRNKSLCKTAWSHCVESVQIRTRKNSEFGHFSRSECVIDDSIHNYCSRLANKLLNVLRNSKPYWSIWQTFLNSSKIPIIPSLVRAEPFNSFFAKQYSLISNGSKLPSKLHYFTEKHV